MAKTLKPLRVYALTGIPIAFIGCRSNHSFAVSTSGTVFACGRGSFGQLGHGGCNDEITPRMVLGLVKV